MMPSCFIEATLPRKQIEVPSIGLTMQVPEDWYEAETSMKTVVACYVAPGDVYPTGAVDLSVHWTGPAGADDPCRHSRPENARGFENTEAWFGQPSGGVNA